MKTLMSAIVASAIVGFAPTVASAADLGSYDDQEAVIEQPAPIIERERIVERRYYEPEYEYYDDAPVVTYYRRPYRDRYPYYAAYPYRFGPYHHYRHRPWRGHARW